MNNIEYRDNLLKISKIFACGEIKNINLSHELENTIGIFLYDDLDNEIRWELNIDVENELSK